MKAINRSESKTKNGCLNYRQHEPKLPTQNRTQNGTQQRSQNGIENWFKDRGEDEGRETIYFR
ncbi:MAG: hypothetical protein ABIK19_03065 [candidate division WOR-3 bacterium]